MTYALTASCIGYADGRKDKFSMKNIAQKLLHSVPFVVYISMLVLSLADSTSLRACIRLQRLWAQATRF